MIKESQKHLINKEQEEKKPVIVRQLFPFCDIPLCKYDNMLIIINPNDSRIAIWLYKSKSQVM